jgi:hypothetical protein
MAGDWGANYTDPAVRSVTLDEFDRAGIPMRRHVLVWLSWRNSPAHLKTDYETLAATDETAAKAALRAAVL